MSSPTDVAEIAVMTRKAKGVGGSCACHIEGVARHLRESGIDDPAIADLYGALTKARAQAH